MTICSLIGPSDVSGFASFIASLCLESLKDFSVVVECLKIIWIYRICDDIANFHDFMTKTFVHVPHLATLISNKAFKINVEF